MTPVASRRKRIIHRLSDGKPSLVGAVLLCQVATDITGTTGAGIALLGREAPQALAGASDTVAARIEQIQADVGDGPGVSAYCNDRTVSEPDLAHPAVPRWNGYTPLALEGGVRAVFAFPLRVGSAHLGALTLYRDEPGPLGEEQQSDAIVMAEVAAEVVILMQADAPAAAWTLELTSSANTRAVVHQAAGMIAGQLDISVARALIELRAHAYATSRRLVAVAEDVVDRRLSFAPA